MGPTSTYDSLADLERKHDGRETGKCPEVVDQTAAAKLAYPGMQTLQAWAEHRGEHSPGQEKNWNKVSLLSLVTGRQ